jgi:hypothetical protein
VRIEHVCDASTRCSIERMIEAPAGHGDEEDDMSAMVPTGPSLARASSLRLTRRGRLLLTLVLLIGMLALAVAWGPSVVATDGAGEPVPVRTVTVQPGQTLWDIAAASGLGGDLRAAVYEMQRLNGLDDAGLLQVGQQLAVPTG